MVRFLYLKMTPDELYQFSDCLLFVVVVVQVFHKIITSGLPRLQPLYDCLLTIMVNSEYSPPLNQFQTCFSYLAVSPYLKTLSMVTCARLMHLMEVK